jgi:transposase
LLASSTTAATASAERELPTVAVGRRNWTFAGSDEGGRRAAALCTLVATAKLNDVDPQAWLADVLARMLDHPEKRVSGLPHNTARRRLICHCFGIETGQLFRAAPAR